MKKLLWAFVCLLLAWPCAAQSNIKMVTYFPVPYAAYKDLSVAGTADVGILEQCQLEVGGSLVVQKDANKTGNLNVGRIILNGGSLNLVSSSPSATLQANVLTLGTSSSTGSGTIRFAHDLYVDKFLNNQVRSLEVNNQANVTKIFALYGKKFPHCSASNNTIRWQNLTFNGEKGLFLMCGGSYR